MIRSFLGTLIVLLVAASAQAEEPPTLARRGFGFAAGGTSGIGFAWREVTPGGFGYQVAGGAWVPSFTEHRAIWSLGLQGIKVIDQTAWWRLYGFLGSHVLGTAVTQDETLAREVPPDPLPKDATQPATPAPEPSPPPTVRVTRVESLVNLGAGFGIELGVSPGVTFALEVPLVFGYRLSPDPGPAHILPIPNACLIYNF